MHRFLIAIAVFWMSLSAAMPSAAQSPAFAVGQTWTLSGAAYPTVRVVIDKLETWHGKPIAHITLLEVPVPAAGNRAAGTTTFQHLPFAEDALRQSVGVLVDAHGEAYAGYRGGYDDWKAANGGVFTISVQDCVTTLLQQLRDAGKSVARDAPGA